MSLSNPALQTLLAQHRTLRQQIGRVRSAARCGEDPRQLRVSVRALCALLLAHLADEEKLLLPLLQHAAGWGKLRTGLLRAEHAHQRAVLAVLPEEPAHLLGPRAIALCDHLLADMEFEEREVFSAELLQDRP